MPDNIRSPVHRTILRFLLESLEALIVSIAVLPTSPRSRRWLSNLGATPEASARSWPADGLVRAPEAILTRALDIDAPPAAVWQWSSRWTS